MPERISVHGSIGYGTMAVGSDLVDILIEQKTLPYDFEFRALGIDEDLRTKVIAKDVLAAVGIGEPSGDKYLLDPLPDCVAVPLISERERIMENVDDTYYSFSDFRKVGSEDGALPKIINSTWVSYVEEFNHSLYEYFKLADRLAKTKDLTAKLNRVIIRDEPLYRRYQSREQYLGSSVIQRRLLHGLLVTNHPDLEPLN